MSQLHTNSKEVHASSSNSQDDKLQKRRARLAAWNQKKASSEKSENNEDKKPKIELLKLQEWIKRRQQKSATPEVPSTEASQKPTSIKPILRARLSTLSSKQTQLVPKKRSIFDDDDEQDDAKTAKKVFRIPNEKKLPASTEEQESEDEEKVLERIRQAESGTSFLVELGFEQDLGADSGISGSEGDEEDDEEGQQRLLSEKLQKLTNKEKKLMALDYTQMEYTSVRKKFYTPPEELKDVPPEKVTALRTAMDGIKVRGSDCPMPIQKWAQLGLPSSIMTVLEEKLGYDTPSPIQSQALPAIMSGRDIIGVANTGSGKTLAFVIPLIRHIMDQPPLKSGDGPIGVILTPTRELALQIQKELVNFTQAVELSVCCCYGGSPIESQIADLKRGTEIIVGTPGRVIDLLAANGGRVTNLRRTTFLVLDEADRMFDMGFEPQVNKVLSQIRPDKQMVLFSATFPKKLESLARSFLVDPIEIVAGGISVVAPEITQRVVLIDDSGDISQKKLQALLKIVDEFSVEDPEGKILIFVDKQEAADDLMVRLLNNQILCIVIHGGKDQVLSLIHI